MLIGTREYSRVLAGLASLSPLQRTRGTCQNTGLLLSNAVGPASPREASPRVPKSGLFPALLVLQWVFQLEISPPGRRSHHVSLRKPCWECQQSNVTGIHFSNTIARKWGILYNSSLDNCLLDHRNKLKTMNYSNICILKHDTHYFRQCGGFKMSIYELICHSQNSQREIKNSLPVPSVWVCNKTFLSLPYIIDPLYNVLKVHN